MYYTFVGDYTHSHPPTVSKSFGGCFTVDSCLWPIFNNPKQISLTRKQAWLDLDPMFIVNEGPSIGPLAQPKAVKQLNKLQSGQLKQLWEEDKVSIMKLLPMG